MARKITPAQARSRIRQAQQKQRQAVNKYNSAVRKHNSEVKRAVNKYNRDVAAHNSRVRANRQRLKREVARLNSSRATTRYVVSQRSVLTLQQSFSRIEASAEAGTWQGGADLFELSEGETANSVAVLNALLTEPGSESTTDPDLSLQSTSIAHELVEISPDLDARWHGALFFLSPSNPDAARRRAWNQAKGRKVKASPGRRGRTSGNSRQIARSRYALWKNPDDLNPRQQQQLDWIAKTDPKLWRAYLLKEGLRYVFAVKGDEGKEALDRWLSWARRSQLESFIHLAKRITKHRDAIEANLEHGLSQGLIESTNTKIRLLTRIAFGFHGPNPLIALALLALGSHPPRLPGRT